MSSRKPIELHTGHRTKVEIATQELENQAATGPRSCFSGSPPKDLIDKIARAEWKRVTKILEDMEIIGDLDYYALIGYCNAFSYYRRATMELADKPLTVETERGTVKNPLINVQDTFANQMRSFAMKAGLSIDTRLKQAALKVKKETDDLEGEFGDI